METGDINQEINTYMVIVEDPDAPLPSPVVHGIYYDIPASKTTLSHADLEAVSDSKNGLVGGFKYGLNRRKCIWSGARPLLAHRAHRYMFQVVGLNSSPSPKRLSEIPTKLELEKAVENKIVAWGVWVGIFERKFGANGE